MGKTVIKPT